MRLEITRRSDLAVRALAELGRRRETVKSAEPSTATGATNGFLRKVMAPLVRAGWVSSDPGPKGGYRLAAALSSISVLDVIETVEDIPPSDVCVLGGGPCSGDGPCTLHIPWLDARAALLATLAATPVGGPSKEER